MQLHQQSSEGRATPACEIPLPLYEAMCRLYFGRDKAPTSPVFVGAEPVVRITELMLWRLSERYYGPAPSADDHTPEPDDPALAEELEASTKAALARHPVARYVARGSLARDMNVADGTVVESHVVGAEDVG